MNNFKKLQVQQYQGYATEDIELLISPDSNLKKLSLLPTCGSFNPKC